MCLTSTLRAQDYRALFVSLGDTRGVDGIRFNFRDTRLDRVNGINITIGRRPRKGMVISTAPRLDFRSPAAATSTVSRSAVAWKQPVTYAASERV
jgi:hypothetical protein